MAFRWLSALVGLLLVSAACARTPGPAPIALRLADLYKPDTVEARVTPLSLPPRTEWRFDGAAPSPAPAKSAATRGWDVLHGVSGLAIRDGRLVGRATDTLPILHLERTAGLDDPDVLHEVQVRLRVSGGSRISVGFLADEKLNRDTALDYARNFTPELGGPVVPGDEMRTYTLRTTFHVLSSRARHVFLQPTDAKGATFEIESLRFVFRREHLASVASGLGWQGLSEVYRETLVARAPETFRFDIRVPARPRLDLAVGTVEDGPVRFRVSVRPQGGQESTVLERTVTRPHRWEPASLDLNRFAGKPVRFGLSLHAEKEGALGFWGGPTLRSREAPPPSARGRRPGLSRPQGIILVWADTLRRDHTGLHGHARPTTPVLDRLAREGTLFRDCIGQATWTKVATPSLLTSLYPSSHGVRDFMDRLPGSAHTLAESFREAGYATLSMSSISFTGKFTNLHQGFEEVHESGSLADRGSSKTSREYVDRLLPWLEAHRDVPFFVFLHVSDPHDPYRPYPPYDTMWADAARRGEHERQDKELRQRIADPLLRHMGSAMPTREDLAAAKIRAEEYVSYDRDWYDGSIRGMDAEMGRLVERLRALGLEGRTLLVFTGDHGEEFLEHGRMLHGQSVYGELNNLPLFFWGPAIVPSGREVEETVETVDLMPTLLEMSRLPVPGAAQGHSLLPLLLPSAPGTGRAAEPWDRPATSEKAVTEDKGSPPPRDTASTAIVSRGFKLIHNTKRPGGRPEFELYDHRADPLDLRDVAAEHPDVVGRLAKELAAWRQIAEQARLKSDTEGAAQLSAEELERLRALGYIQ
jgi:arylsulfatase A-like enzyme